MNTLYAGVFSPAYILVIIMSEHEITNTINADKFISVFCRLISGICLLTAILFYQKNGVPNSASETVAYIGFHFFLLMKIFDYSDLFRKGEIKGKRLLMHLIAFLLLVVCFFYSIYLFDFTAPKIL